MEFKVANEKIKDKKYSEEELEELANIALKQIEDKKYYTEYTVGANSVRPNMYKKEDFILVGIGFQGKECAVATNVE